MNQDNVCDGHNKPMNLVGSNYLAGCSLSLALLESVCQVVSHPASEKGKVSLCVCVSDSRVVLPSFLLFGNDNG